LLPVISNVLAKSVTDPTQINDLLVKQVTSRVRWRESINELKTLGITDIVEIGSGKVLTGLIKRIEPEINCHNLGKIEDLENISELLAN
jgi:[acyl-carrier-protein] S-malonyltransferase